MLRDILFYALLKSLALCRVLFLEGLHRLFRGLAVQAASPRDCSREPSRFL